MLVARPSIAGFENTFGTILSYYLDRVAPHAGVTETSRLAQALGLGRLRDDSADITVLANRPGLFERSDRTFGQYAERATADKGGNLPMRNHYLLRNRLGGGNACNDL